MKQSERIKLRSIDGNITYLIPVNQIKRIVQDKRIVVVSLMDREIQVLETIEEIEKMLDK
jgi:DNA-binding LytR/AlgR family response regulator